MKYLSIKELEKEVKENNKKIKEFEKARKKQLKQLVKEQKLVEKLVSLDFMQRQNLLRYYDNLLNGRRKIKERK